MCHTRRFFSLGLLGRPPAATAPPTCLAGNCEPERDDCAWVEQRLAELALPEFPSLPSAFTVPKVLPLPRLLPSIEFIQSHKRGLVDAVGGSADSWRGAEQMTRADETQMSLAAADAYDDAHGVEPPTRGQRGTPSHVAAGPIYTDELEWPRAPDSYDAPYKRVQVFVFAHPPISPICRTPRFPYLTF